MNSKQLIIFLASLTLAVVGITTLIMSTYFIEVPQVEQMTIQMSATTTPEMLIGMNVDSDALYFGTVPQKGTGKRYMNVTNENDKVMQATLAASGNISEHVIFKKNFTLQPGETEYLTFEFTAREANTTEQFEGNLTLTFVYS